MVREGGLGERLRRAVVMMAGASSRSRVAVAWLSERMMMPSVIRKIPLPPKMTMKAITKLLFVLKKSRNFMAKEFKTV